jgi:hypothetical protein
MTEVNMGSAANTNSAQSPQPENFLLSDRLTTPVVDPEMIFSGLWPAETIALFTGDGGIGKTHWMLQVSYCIASGGKIDGTPFICPTSRDVVFISQEDDAEFLRGELLNQFPGLQNEPDIAKRIRIISTALQGQNLFLTNPNSRRYIIAHLPPGCVFILDAWSTVLTSDENTNTEILKNEIESLRSIMKTQKATPLLIHHRPKRNSSTLHQGTYRGASALPNSCRFHIMLSSKDIGVRLSFEKVSRGAKPEPIDLIFDEDRKIFVPEELDKYVSAFQLGEELTTTQFIQRLGKDPTDSKERNKALDILRRRSPGLGAGPLEKTQPAKKGQDAVWKRIK